MHGPSTPVSNNQHQQRRAPDGSRRPAGIRRERTRSSKRRIRRWISGERLRAAGTTEGRRRRQASVGIRHRQRGVHRHPNRHVVNGADGHRRASSRTGKAPFTRRRLRRHGGHRRPGTPPGVSLSGLLRTCEDQARRAGCREPCQLGDSSKPASRRTGVIAREVGPNPFGFEHNRPTAGIVSVRGRPG